MGVLFAVAAQASDEHDAEARRHHDSHVHGQGELSVATDGDQLQINLKAPAADLLGFEHAPQNEEEMGAVAALKSQLKDMDALFALGGAARCALNDVTFHLGGLDDAGSDKHEHKHDNDKADEDGGHEHGDHQDEAHEDAKHKDGDHAASHDHDSKDTKDTGGASHAHAHDDDHADANESAYQEHEHKHEHDHQKDGDKEDSHEQHHTDIEVTYALTCGAVQSLSSLTVKLFDLYPKFSEIDAVYLMEDKQSAHTLRTEDRVLNFR